MDEIDQSITEKEIEEKQTEQRSSRVKKVLGEKVTPEEIQAGELDQLELLQEVYKGASSSMQSIEGIRPMSKDKAFRSMLFQHYNSYKTLSKETELQAASEGYSLRPFNILNKAVNYGTILFSTFNDRSNSKLAELMIQNVNTGIINLVRIINSLDADLQIDQTLSNKLLELFHNNLEAYKHYL